jgi:microcystin-dependent protein
MSEPYIGQIQPFGFNFAPRGWAFCNGQILGIAQHTALFSLIGTNYGGNGSTTFALPDLRGRVPMHQGTPAGGQPYVMGQSGGEESIVLLPSEMPAHSHGLVGTSAAANSRRPVTQVRRPSVRVGNITLPPQAWPRRRSIPPPYLSPEAASRIQTCSPT